MLETEGEGLLRGRVDREEERLLPSPPKFACSVESHPDANCFLVVVISKGVCPILIVMGLFVATPSHSPPIKVRRASSQYWS